MIEDDFLFESEPEVVSHALNKEHGEARNQLAVQMLRRVRESLSHVIHLLESGDTARATRQLVDLVSDDRQLREGFEAKTGSRVLEGIFHGTFMLGSDGERYEIPHNYASKSKLVQGDILKLTIQPEGGYVYKQIGPVERQRVRGRLGIDQATQEPVVQVGDRLYKVLAASVTYHKGVAGDEVVILLPRDREAEWGAVEAIVSKQV